MLSTPAIVTRILLFSIDISGSLTPKTLIRLSIILYVLSTISGVTLDPSILFTSYKTSNPPCKSSPNFKFLIE